MIKKQQRRYPEAVVAMDRALELGQQLDRLDPDRRHAVLERLELASTLGDAAAGARPKGGKRDVRPKGGKRDIFAEVGAEVGRPAWDYLRDYRLETAAHLLLETPIPLGESAGWWAMMATTRQPTRQIVPSRQECFAPLTDLC